MRTLKNQFLHVVFAGCLAGVIAPAFAQENVLEEVIVTAQKRPQNQNDVGISLSAFTSSQIEELNLRFAPQVSQYTPGFLFTETAPNGVPVYTIRGVGFDDYSAASSPTVGFYTDEVYLPYSTMTRGPLFDLNSIEILKGPQGTLYGRNTTGGAVKFASNKPSESVEAGVSLEYARYNTIRAMGFVSGKVSESLNGRFAFTTTQSNEGWQRSSSGDDTLGEQNIGAIRGILDWMASATVDVQFIVHWYQDKSDNQAAQFFAYVPSVPHLAPYFPAPPEDTRPDLSNPRSADWGQRLRPQRDNKGSGASATINWSIGKLKLTSITAFEHFDRKETNDWDGSYIENLDSENFTQIAAWSEELRLASAGNGDFEWMIGAYFSWDDVTDQFIPHSSSATISQGIISGADVISEQETSTAAAFAHIEWPISNEWRLIGGLRYTYEEREWTGCSHDYEGGIAFLFNSDLGPIPGLADHFYISSTPLTQGDCGTIDPARAGFIFDPENGEMTVFGGESDSFKDTIEVNNVSAKIGLDWTPSDELLVYFSISSGFKSGGFNGAVASSWAALYPYGEEELLAYEMGFKLTLLEGSMQINADTFYYNYQDKQVTGFFQDSIFGIFTNLVNIPKSSILGAESEFTWQATEGLLLRLSAAWLDTEVKEYVGMNSSGVVQNFAGLPLAQAPEWQINGLASQTWNLNNGMELTIQADFNFSDGYFTAITDDPLFYVGDYTIWNARMILTSREGAWNLMAWGKNLTDHYYFTSANIANDYRFRLAGLGCTYGLTFSYFWY